MVMVEYHQSGLKESPMSIVWRKPSIIVLSRNRELVKFLCLVKQIGMHIGLYNARYNH